MHSLKKISRYKTWVSLFSTTATGNSIFLFDEYLVKMHAEMHDGRNVNSLLNMSALNKNWRGLMIIRKILQY
jgi:hypothetical protein